MIVAVIGVQFLEWFCGGVLCLGVTNVVVGPFHCCIKLLVVAGLFSALIEVERQHRGWSLLLAVQGLLLLSLRWSLLCISWIVRRSSR